MLTKSKSITLIQGVFSESFFDRLKKSKVKNVFVLEGRPNLDSARSSCKELLKRGIIPTLVTDNMGGFLFYKKLVKEVCVAYQKLADDGALCDIGALILAVLGKTHKVPVKVFPGKRTTKFMGKTADLFSFQNVRVAAKGIKGYVPLVEWVPKKYITKAF